MASAAPIPFEQTEVWQLGRFVAAADHRRMSAEAREELKKRILDSMAWRSVR